ncbi:MULTISPECIES: GntR family transcriptional regulator [unclassified Ruminococcus]|uniref:GntR family transcriptional regulator n=1 Tax=unclassified Ruminococcus TaxID=2608920 RepID=UPI00210B8CD1|nr:MULTISPECIES: GntR family transcriptional regulator [unclassified Ruminococcus]MCQ4023032.1 GntR family transcriptional regulator [Ruminococcus sp. zg-924]MCQ4115469.1 GntR family transcriptional regulator [Ruminococcus sp. zg-921]
MNIFIRNTSGEPIYEQIYNQIKAAIVSGELKTDEAIPSIRSLAKDLRISVITTKRAYEELERDGFIYTVPGRGCFVAKQNIAMRREESLQKIEEHLKIAYELAKGCNVSKGELVKMFELMGEEWC